MADVSEGGIGEMVAELHRRGADFALVVQEKVSKALYGGGFPANHPAYHAAALCDGNQLCLVRRSEELGFEETIVFLSQEDGGVEAGS